MKQKYYCCPDIDSYENETFPTIQETVESVIAEDLKYRGVIGGIIELVESRKSGHRYCNWREKYFEPGEDYYCNRCRDKEFIGRSHICKHLSWCFMPTGRVWEYNHDGGEYDEKKLRRVKK